MDGEKVHAMIVVGLDGSAGSIEAMRWAMNLARSTGAEVRALMAWDFPPSYGYAPPATKTSTGQEPRNEHSTRRSIRFGTRP